jgi:hypothetical protein
MALNFNPSVRLDGVAPLTAFLALPAQTPLKKFYLSKYKGELPKVTEAQWSTEAQQHLQDLQVSMEHLQGKLSDAAMKKLKTKRNVQDARARAPNFEVEILCLSDEL